MSSVFNPLAVTQALTQPHLCPQEITAAHPRYSEHRLSFEFILAAVMMAIGSTDNGSRMSECWPDHNGLIAVSPLEACLITALIEKTEACLHQLRLNYLGFFV